MKKIIVPVDFSETAKNAYLFARQLSEQQGSQIKVVHICHPGVDAVGGIAVPDLDVLIAQKEKQLHEFTQLDQSGSIGTAIADSMTEQEVVLGFASEELIKRSKNPDTEMILMGTTGSSNVLTKLFGSISTSVAQYAHCPVWLIPPEAKFDGIKKILYAGNYESANQTLIEQIINFADSFNAQIQLLHVEKGGDKKDKDMEAFFLEALFKKIAPSLDYILHTVEEGNITKTLFQHAEEKEADLIVLVTHHRNFWENLFHKSTTKSMVLNARKPLLILHAK